MFVIICGQIKTTEKYNSFWNNRVHCVKAIKMAPNSWNKGAARGKCCFNNLRYRMEWMELWKLLSILENIICHIIVLCTPTSQTVGNFCNITYIGSLIWRSNHPISLPISNLRSYFVVKFLNMTLVCVCILFYRCRLSANRAIGARRSIISYDTMKEIVTVPKH